MENEARILLDDVIEFCRRDGREPRLINMLEQCGASDFDDESLTVAVPSRFACTYLEKQREVIESYLEEISFMPMRLEVVVEDRNAGCRDAGKRAAAAVEATPGAGEPTLASILAQAEQDDDAPEDMATFPGVFDHVPAYAEAGRVGGAPEPSPGVRAGRPNSAAAGAMNPTPIPSPALASPHKQPGTEEARSGINVVNTVSADTFRRMMQEMRGAQASGTAGAGARDTDGQHGPSAASSGSVTPATRADDAPVVDINAKYTFESFVAGDENRHAFNSAMRFAAFAEEPGQCPSLFIYGNSGLGKTHLLFAVRNYLAKEKPYIRVKYANSQAYLDDYMNELGTQRGPGSLIMREYRDADILIIDDVQNIVGKQASVEFFFQLVDSFIREGKKIAFASDRAPKDLAMDERLTSRFSRGMLCLVSEPGFEMKYVILKRYYENIINGSESLDGLNVDTSLLSMLPEHEGHLTDEHLRHMAEISGNNIRNLESFCERCAGLAAEREAAGGELSAEDIDETAKTYFNTARKVIHIDTVQRVVEEFYHVSHEELIGPRRTASIAFARHVAVYLANSLCEMTTPAIGAEFGGRDHSTVLNSLKVVENKMREDRRICEDLQNLKNTIMLKS